MNPFSRLLLDQNICDDWPLCCAGGLANFAPRPSQILYLGERHRAVLAITISQRILQTRAQCRCASSTTVGNREADKHGEGSRNISLDEGTLNQILTIIKMIFDKVTCLLQHNSEPSAEGPSPAAGDLLRTVMVRVRTFVNVFHKHTISIENTHMLLDMFRTY